jgi:hypothetical protein
LEGATFQGCVFRKVKFHNANIRSSWITRCEFHECDFSEAYLADCTFTACCLFDCSFAQALINESFFVESTLAGNVFQKGSFSLDVFRKCLIERSTFGDCTFLNHIFVGCRFREIKINAESVGTCFGITLQDLETFDFIHLGEDVYKAGSLEDILSALEAEFQTRHWFVALALLRLNFGRLALVVALREVLTAILIPAQHGLPLRRDDAMFLRLVMRELADQRRLPGFSCFDVVEKVDGCLKDETLARVRGKFFSP